MVQDNDPALAFGSGGLGLSVAEWEELHGVGRKDTIDWLQYESGAYVVGPTDTNLNHIERVWGDQNAVTFDAARAEGKRLAPSDATLVRSYTSKSGSAVDLYLSNALIPRFPPETSPLGPNFPWWTNGSPGNFVIVYRPGTSGRVTSIVVALGDIP